MRRGVYKPRFARLWLAVQIYTVFGKLGDISARRQPRFIRRGDDPEVRQAIASSSSFLSRQREEEDTDGADRACRTTRGDHMRAGSEGRTKRSTKRVEGGVRRCLAVASRCGNDFVVSSERKARKSFRVGGEAPHTPLVFLFFFFFFLEALECAGSERGSTPLARPAPKAGALDHSATLSSNRRKLASYSF